MIKVKKAICTFLCMLLLCGSVSLFAFAEECDCSLTLVYRGDGNSFEGLEISIYRVGDRSDTEGFALAEGYDYPINVSGITTQDEWRNAATTLYSYIVADGKAPTATQTTNSNGEAVFENLQEGLYLVLTVQAQTDSTVYTFENVFVSLPSADSDGNSIKDVVAQPKSGSQAVEPQERQLKVVKQWQDNGNADKRPDSVTVELYKDGALQSTQTLSSQNNWSYSWTDVDDGGVWTAVECDVPESYSVTVGGDGAVITVTNTYVSPTPPPATGDTYNLWLYVLLALFSGCGMIIFAVYKGRATA